MIKENTNLLQGDDLRVYFGSKQQPLRAVDGVSLHVGEGEILGLVGESGCGKSSLGRALIRMENLHSGKIQFDGEDVGTLKGNRLKTFRKKVQMIFQDPFGSLSPRLSVGKALDEVLYVHNLGNARERRERAEELFKAVGLDPAYLDRYPHEFSGGQRQRIGIARALAVQPSLIIADEPVSALDVSVQVQILNLLKDLQKDMGLSFVFIAHDLAVVRYVAERIMVMYLGKIVESGPSEELYGAPAHPYTEALLSAVPDVEKGLEQGARDRIVLKGDVPSPTRKVAGCPFHTRCHRAREKCSTEEPAFRQVSTGRWSACHFAEEVTSNL